MFRKLVIGSAAARWLLATTSRAQLRAVVHAAASRAVSAWAGSIVSR
jgi:hypothetical protein